MLNLTPSWRCQSGSEHARHAARQGEWGNLQQRDRRVQRCDAWRGHGSKRGGEFKRRPKKVQGKEKRKLLVGGVHFLPLGLLMLLFLFLMGYCRGTGCITFIGLGFHC